MVYNSFKFVHIQDNSNTDDKPHVSKRGGSLTRLTSLANVGAIGAGELASLVLVPGRRQRRLGIIDIDRAKWVWDVDRPRLRGDSDART